MKKGLHNHRSDDRVDIYRAFFKNFCAFQGLGMGDNSVNGRPTTEGLENSLGRPQHHDEDYLGSYFST